MMFNWPQSNACVEAKLKKMFTAAAPTGVLMLDEERRIAAAVSCTAHFTPDSLTLDAALVVRRADSPPDSLDRLLWAYGLRVWHAGPDSTRVYAYRDFIEADFRLTSGALGQVFDALPPAYAVMWTTIYAGMLGTGEYWAVDPEGELAFAFDDIAKVACPGWYCLDSFLELSNLALVAERPPHVQFGHRWYHVKYESRARWAPCLIIAQMILRRLKEAGIQYLRLPRDAAAK
jgi:hypothetical protein